jgi:hypothetical protein
VGIGELLGQLIAAQLTVELVLGRVDLGCLAQDPPGLHLQPLIGAVGAQRGIGGQLGRVDRDRSDPHHPRPRTQRQHLSEQLR